MRRVTLALVLGAVVVALSGCADQDEPVAATGLQTRTVTAGDVDVTITPTRIDDDEARFAIAFDTHTVDLDTDVEANVQLTIGGRAWMNPTWDGAGPGGHHREGTLSFTAPASPSGEAVLTINGLDEPVTARWDLPAGG